MIKLFEQCDKLLCEIIDEDAAKIINEKLSTTIIKENGFQRGKQENKEDSFYLKIHYLKDREQFHFQTSYFIGVDWIIENEQAVYVQPKLNKKEVQIDYLTMLFEALQEPENYNHLDGLLEIDFRKPYIEIDQQIDILSPFLIIQFIYILKNIAQKGLKKKYYKIENNLEAKVKGKILLNKTIKTNLLKNKFSKTVCRYNEFDVNNDENKILKVAFSFAKKVLFNYQGLKKEEIEHVIKYIDPVFENISEDVDFNMIKSFKPNPIFREYEQALNLAKLILKKYSYNIQNTAIINKIVTPPFWIDMSKLFELYLFKKLKKLFPKHNELIYHYKAHYQELDFLLNHKGKNQEKIQMVIDAKYKPYYEFNNISKEDALQVSGYARLKNIYKHLSFDENSLIDCLIIYSDHSENYSFEKEDLKKYKDNHYQNFYKLGIGLPRIQ